tara:strand:+ start:10826 stop:11470 length:645 start_codon:yes stop_codon:yes gene_type:complete
MSNALNASLANAWFSADIAVNKQEVYQLKKQKQEEYEEKLEELTKAQKDEAKEEGMFSTIGSIIGAGIGMATGGPAGAMAGYKIGAGAGSFVHGVTSDDAELRAMAEELESFDWELGQLGNKYSALESAKWEEEGEDISEATMDAYEQWSDDFYDPWYEDAIEDLAIPIASQFTMSQIGDFLRLDDPMSWYHDWVLPEDMANINPNTGKPYVYI